MRKFIQMLAAMSCGLLLVFLSSAGTVKSEDDFPEFKDVVTKEFEKVVVADGKQGYYTLYLNKKKNQLYGEISGLDQEFLLATSFASGPYSGYQWSDGLFVWERMDKKLVLKQPEYRYIVSEGGPLENAVKRTHRDQVITSVPILCMGDNGPIIDLGSFLTEEASEFVGAYGYANSGLSKVQKAKAFPDNVEVAIDLVSTDDLGTRTLHYSISKLPDSSYKPRVADNRIGYFTTTLKDYSKGEKETDNFVRYVTRWNLEKADDTLKLSPPKKPIVYYIEKTVPIKYRRYVEEGILEWNKAFEKIGIRNAIEVRQQADNNEYRDLDPEDVRYNFFRWITSDEPFAMGPSRIDPRSGEILDADIIMDNSMVLSYLKDHDFMIAQNAIALAPDHIKKYLRDNPDRRPWNMMETKMNAAETKRFEDILNTDKRDIPLGGHCAGCRYNRPTCSMRYGMGRSYQMGLASIFFAVDGEEKPAEGGDKSEGWPEEFIGAVIKDTVMHEVGHTLGLRHNFKASAYRSIAEINVENPPADIAASVMDYLPLNIRPKSSKLKQGNYVMRSIGPYDYWAIEYGYTFNGGAEDLKKIASLSGEKGHAYGTDEDVDSSDPLINRWDLGKDTMVQSAENMVLVEELMKDLIKRTVKDGQSYDRARKGFNRLLGEFFWSARYVGQYVGGEYMNRVHKGDPNTGDPIVMVDAAEQKKALAFLAEKFFSDSAYQFDPELLNKLGSARWDDWGASPDNAEYPIHDQILMQQSYVLFDLLNPYTVGRIYDNEMKTPGDKEALTVPDLIESLSGSICKEMLAPAQKDKGYSNRRPMINSTRRNLQRQYFSVLVTMALEGRGGYYPQSAKTIAWHELKSLSEKLGASVSTAKAAKIDRYSMAHLEECKAMIDKALEAKFSME